jgi:demethylmenaquinone methyltransferase/2-methoxy-6-polyprenyl-1,4-benzoquinol methylase
MLKKGQAKIERRGYDRILPVCGDAISLPLPDDSFDCVSMAFGIRNIEPRQRAYAEMYRVLAPGGRLCLLEFGSSQDRIWKGLYNTYLHLILPLAGRMISKDPQAYNYLARTIQGFPKAPFLARELVAAGFERLGFLPLQSGIVYLYIAEKPGWG